MASDNFRAALEIAEQALRESEQRLDVAFGAAELGGPYSAVCRGLMDCVRSVAFTIALGPAAMRF